MQTIPAMPAVSACSVRECAYNRELKCHARAITVGGGLDHHCDTVFKEAPHVRREDTAGVGACKSINCMYNRDLECTAASISVAMNSNRADCMTFTPK